MPNQIKPRIESGGSTKIQTGKPRSKNNAFTSEEKRQILLGLENLEKMKSDIGKLEERVALSKEKVDSFTFFTASVTLIILVTVAFATIPLFYGYLNDRQDYTEKSIHELYKLNLRMELFEEKLNSLKLKK